MAPAGTGLVPLLLAGLASRLALLIWAGWQDTHMAVKYTDIDYFVITDAAQAVLAGGSPYDRATFRYSPLLAWMALPNHLLHPSAAKVCFCAADLGAAWLMACLLERRRAPVAWVKAGLAVWLFSPFTAVISTRGSGEALVTCMLLGMLCLLDAGRPLLAGLCYGLAVHWRLYPIIYALPLLRNLAMRRGARLLSIPGIVFGAAAAAAFLTLGGLGYHLYGHSFLQETYLYHLGRVDPRHNFSPFFLPTYLASGGGAGISIGGVFGAAQALLITVLGWLHAADLPYAMLLQTLAFVTFNKVARMAMIKLHAPPQVSTAQYFVWYVSLLPLVLPRLAAAHNRGQLLWAAGMCSAAIAHWLAWAYALEFLGWSVFLPVWVAGLGVLLAKSWLLACLMPVPQGQASDGFLYGKACKKKIT
ncbi:hypothetical protein APUTEX25_003934 [Auxenochlorella protothecoides]|uniref:GPI mannosyltransferase 1 n=1 Tax=Auxenochlorella protothecoides TaxID=3075 RepID=A0A3M7KVN7_AUXPR|nr:hypothetical protein APUTEX25_003934 [Auxenochlorella protothecoides]|eukprot:RMZ53795.1 hypothetical protein APUTEX25_003934 [Auxenochlorella protothecoides]